MSGYGVRLSYHVSSTLEHQLTLYLSSKSAGALDGTQYISRSNPNWMHAGSISPGPRQLALSDIESVVCGRKHFACLDKDGTSVVPSDASKIVSL
jgi:hypothetical protein